MVRRILRRKGAIYSLRSHRRYSVRKDILKNFANFTEKHQNIYFVEHLQTAASDGSEGDESENDDGSYNKGIETVVRRCSSK